MSRIYNGNTEMKKKNGGGNDDWEKSVSERHP